MRDTVTGTIRRAGLESLSYGDVVRFDTTVTGRVPRKARLYVQVLGTQHNLVVYQYSEERGFPFPLEQQTGLAALGLVYDPTESADFIAFLIYREEGPSTVIRTLDQVGFTTQPR